MTSIIYVGADVHKDSIMFSVFKGISSEPLFERKVLNESIKVKKFIRDLKKQGEVIVCYEAGFSGFDLYRMFEGLGVKCKIAAPGLIPKKPGLRIKTDRRDARSLAQNLMNNQITPIYVPTEKDEAVRDYLRMCEDFKSDLRKTKQRLLHFFHRHGKKYPQGTYWTQRHEKWIKSLSFQQNELQEVLNEYFYHIKDLQGKIEKIKMKIEEISQGKEYREKVGILKCFKGVETLTALSHVTEVGDFRRFSKAGHFTAFLGLVPSEHSSGPKQNKGGITKTGNSNLRRLLIESAWSYLSYNYASKRLSKRRKGHSRQIIAYADKAGRRLHNKYWRLVCKGKSSKVAATAVARELACFIWGMMNNKIA